MREDELRKMEQKHQDIREEFAERMRVLQEKMQHTQENVCAQVNREYCIDGYHSLAGSAPRFSAYFGTIF
jgi:hypothetical protein